MGFGLSFGLSPSPYAATADMLARNVNPWPRLCWMVGGLFAGATILYVLLQTFNPASLVSGMQNRIDDDLFNRMIDLIAGIVFLAMGGAIALWAILVRRLPHRPPKPPKQNTHMFNYFTLGLGSAVVGFTTLPIMYLIGRIITHLTPDPLLRLLAYAVFLFALGAPFFVLAWVWQFFPGWSARITKFYDSALQRDYRWLGAVLLFATGLVFLWLSFFARR
jgi:hypothetical protein